EIVIVLTLLRTEVPIVRIALAGGQGLALAGDLLMEQALELAERNFDQPLVEDHFGQWRIESGAHALHGLAGPVQRRGVPAKLVGCGAGFLEQEFEQRPVGIGLPAAGIVEGNVAAALIAALAVPVGFAVARKIEVGPG